MVRRRILINLAFFTLVAMFFVYWAITNIISVEFIERPFRVTGDFENAMGVLPNAEVTYLGTQVGLVESVERRPDGVRVTMKLYRDKRVPKDATAHIFRKSALGEQYIDFFNPPDFKPGAPILEEGDHIPRDRTQIPIEFADMLRAADALVSSIDPADLKVITHELAVGLQGRTDDLRSLIVEGDRLSAMFAERTDALDRLATNNTRLTRVFAAHSDALASSLEDLRAVTESLKGVAGSVGPLVDNGAVLFSELAPIVHDHRDSLACLFDAVDSVVDLTTTPARLTGLEGLLVNMPVATDQLKQATDVETDAAGRKHQFVRVDLTDDTTNEAPDYAPNRSTPPAQPSIPACAVQFASVDPGEVAAGAPTTGPTPATGSTLGLTVGLGLLVLVGVVRRLAPAVPA
ncbi:MAG TPA: MlaD family protein [Acidimicrobiia bacterium]|nr:MlaD family protein [Acidimicrobiia bacterium]